MVKRPRIIAGTIVWGESYIRNFVKYALPTWLSSGNLPALFQHFDGEFRFYTREKDLSFFGNSPLFERLKQIVPIYIYKLDIDDKPGVNVTHGAYYGGIVADARNRNEAVAYLTPDLLWADGSLGYIGKSLASNNTTVLAPDYRVVTETIGPELDQFRIGDGTIKIPPASARLLLLRHLSPLTGCYYVGCKHIPDHGEILIWSVKNEGLLFYNMSKDSHFFWPSRIKFTPQQLPDHNNDFSKFDLVQNTDYAFGLSLTPLAQNLNWLRQGKPFDPVRIAQFLLCFYTTHNDTRIRRPVLVPLVDRITPQLWNFVENEAAEHFNTIAKCANAMATENSEFTYPPAPLLLPGNDNPTDIDLCVEALEWLGPVIAQRFQQRVIAYLGELRRKYPGGDLPGYCSSWPTVLPPRP